jgi:hypothetical protein
MFRRKFRNIILNIGLISGIAIEFVTLTFQLNEKVTLTNLDKYNNFGLIDRKTKY